MSYKDIIVFKRKTTLNASETARRKNRELLQCADNAAQKLTLFCAIPSEYI